MYSKPGDQRDKAGLQTRIVKHYFANQLGNAVLSNIVDKLAWQGGFSKQVYKAAE